MISVNRVILCGNVGKDPEVKTFSSGKKSVLLSLATSESWNDRQTGERKEKSEWHRVVIQNNDRIADFVEKYVRKGDKLYVEGAIETRKYTGQDGQEKFSTQITVGFGGVVQCDSKGQRSEGQRQDAPQQRSGGGNAGSNLDDEIPFAPCWQ